VLCNTSTTAARTRLNKSAVNHPNLDSHRPNFISNFTKLYVLYSPGVSALSSRLKPTSPSSRNINSVTSTSHLKITQLRLSHLPLKFLKPLHHSHGRCICTPLTQTQKIRSSHDFQMLKIKNAPSRHVFRKSLLQHPLPLCFPSPKRFDNRNK